MQDEPRPHPIRFRSAAEFRERPAYRFDLDPDAHKLKEIFGDYEWSEAEKIKCGLKGCHREHWHGYTVRTVDDLETNVGRDCGKKHFKVNWGEVHSAFGRAAEARNNQEWLDSMVRQREKLMARANSFYAVVANRTKEVQEIREKISKEPSVWQALQRVIRAGGVIQIEREISKDAADARGLRESQRRYLETVGRIHGVEALQSGYRPNKLKGDDVLGTLKSQVMASLNRLATGSLKALNWRQQKERVKEIQKANSLLAAADEHLANTRRFLTPANLRELGKLPVDKPNERARRILKQFAQLPD